MIFNPVRLIRFFHTQIKRGTALIAQEAISLGFIWRWGTTIGSILCTLGPVSSSCWMPRADIKPKLWSCLNEKIAPKVQRKEML
jgi:hypothetical protein